jgi:hypothetical protein
MVSLESAIEESKEDRTDIYWFISAPIYRHTRRCQLWDGNIPERSDHQRTRNILTTHIDNGKYSLLTRLNPDKGTLYGCNRLDGICDEKKCTNAVWSVITIALLTMHAVRTKSMNSINNC